MNCRVVELRHKDVINSDNGCKIGCVDDIEVDTKTARVCSIVIFGPLKCFGIFGRHEDCIIPWENIRLIGEDAILVSCDQSKYRKNKRKRKFFKFK